MEKQQTVKSVYDFNEIEVVWQDPKLSQTAGQRSTIVGEALP